MEGAFKEHIKALVLAGFPTTKTLTSLLANLSKASPNNLNVFTLDERKSFFSLLSLFGIAPTKKAASTSLNATSGSVVFT